MFACNKLQSNAAERTMQFDTPDCHSDSALMQGANSSNDKLINTTILSVTLTEKHRPHRSRFFEFAHLRRNSQLPLFLERARVARFKS